MKRKASKRQFHGQLNLSGVDKPLQAELSAYAKTQRRSRSAQTVLLLREILAIKKSTQ